MYLSNKQKTIDKEICFKGIGLHSGEYSNVILKPASEDTGILFIRRNGDLVHSIPADFKFVSNSKLCTTLESYDSKSKVFTVEHLLAAVKGNDIDNLIIEVDKDEIPALDGSAIEFDKIIKESGVVEQKKFKKYLFLKKPIYINKNGSTINLEPSQEFKINCTIDFPKPIGTQEIILGNSVKKIYEKVLNARTFCFFENIEDMKKIGLAKGGSLENALVIKENKILNPEGLRYSDEFVRHKVLDIIGDFALMNYNLKFKINAYCPGHEINKLTMQKIFSDFNNYNISQETASSKTYRKTSFLSVCN